jgi:hypothetical protein
MDAHLLVTDYYRHFLGHEPERKLLDFWVDHFEKNSSSPNEVIQILLASDAFKQVIEPLARFYTERSSTPLDYSALKFWVDEFYESLSDYKRDQVETHSPHFRLKPEGIDAETLFIFLNIFVAVQTGQNFYGNFQQKQTENSVTPEHIIANPLII